MGRRRGGSGERSRRRLRPANAGWLVNSRREGDAMSSASDDHLIWIDLEMTGLDPGADSIIEIASVDTDRDVAGLAEGPVIAIHHAPERLQAMDDWNRRQHRKTGLWERVLAST